MSIDEELEALPVYVREANAEEQADIEAWVKEQEANIDEQIADEIPAKHLKIRCSCGAFVPWRHMYRCLYCKIWLCKTCAQLHYGYRIP